jgi:hypothetical protein
MKTVTCALAVLAAVSTAAVAKDLKQDNAPSGQATVMTDTEMDNVTAGSTPSTKKEGTITALSAGGNVHASPTGLAHGIGTAK